MVLSSSHTTSVKLLYPTSPHCNIKIIGFGTDFYRIFVIIFWPIRQLVLFSRWIYVLHREMAIYHSNAFFHHSIRFLCFRKHRRKIEKCLDYVVPNLAQREVEFRKSIVHAIHTELMRILLVCIKGIICFEGCNLLLQLWVGMHKR